MSEARAAAIRRGWRQSLLLSICTPGVLVVEPRLQFPRYRVIASYRRGCPYRGQRPASAITSASSAAIADVMPLPPIYQAALPRGFNTRLAENTTPAANMARFSPRFRRVSR